MTQSNPSTLWKERSRLKTLIREFFDSRNFLEIDTPLAVLSPGTEVHLQYFGTQWKDFDSNLHPLYLRSSPELHMKQALAEGCKHIYQIGPCFRNGGELSTWHQPEFTMLEWYAGDLSFDGLMQQTEDLLRFVANKFGRESTFSQCLEKIPSIPRLSVYEAFQKYVGVTLIDGDIELGGKCKVSGVLSIQDNDDFETAFFKTLIEKIEPQMAAMPICFLMDYPPSQAALAQVKDGKACRFECYFGRVELCNGFFELLGERENRIRVQEAADERAKVGLDLVPVDEDFLKAMGKIDFNCSGNALGFDRLLALLCDEESLDRVVPFRRRPPYSKFY